MSENRKSKSVDKCYMCDADGTTAEHVPPRSFFPKGNREHLWSVPSCTAHNYDNNLDVEYVRNVIGIQINCKGAAQEATQNTAFRSWTYSPKLLSRTFHDVRPIVVNGEETGCFSFDLPRFKLVMRAIAHALYRRETGENYQGRWEVFSPNLGSRESVFQGLPDDWNKFRTLVQQLQFGLRSTPHPEVFKYGMCRFDDEHFVYAFLFYEGFTVYVWTASLDDPESAQEETVATVEP